MGSIIFEFNTQYLAYYLLNVIRCLFDDIRYTVQSSYMFIPRMIPKVIALNKQCNMCPSGSARLSLNVNGSVGLNVTEMIMKPANLCSNCACIYCMVLFVLIGNRFSICVVYTGLVVKMFVTHLLGLSMEVSGSII